MATPPTPPRLTERDVSYLKLLKTLKQSPTVTEGALGVVRRIAAWYDGLPVLEMICLHQPWLDDWEVKEALVHNDRTSARHRQEIEKAIAIFDLLREMDAPDLTDKDKAEIQEDIKYLFKTLPEHDRAVVKKHAYDLSATRHGKTGHGVGVVAPPPAPSVAASPAAPPAPAPPAAPSAAPAAEHGGFTQAIAGLDGTTDIMRVAEQEAFETAEEAAAALAGEPEDEEHEDVAAAATAGAAMGHVSRDQKVALARTTTDAQALGLLVFDADEQVMLALLENPHLDDRLASTLARRAPQRVAADIYRRRAIFMRPLVRQALMENPSAPSSALLEALNSISDIVELLRILKSPKVKFLEVKAKARARLAMIFKALGQGEKIAAIRRAGSPLLKELWTDFFRDEALVVKCVQEKQVDQNIVLEIARSKIAPRRALEIIGTTAQYTANYQICLELVMNPKTPRQVVTHLIPKLNPADRKMLKNNPAVPEAIRRFA